MANATGMALGMVRSYAIALGATTNRGPVFDGAVRRDGAMLITTETGQRSLCATGVGSPALLDALWQDWSEEFAAATSFAVLERRLQVRLTSLYREHIFPAMSAVRADASQRLNALVGVTWGSQSALWRHSRTRLVRCHRHTIGGRGRRYAETLLSRILPASDYFSLELGALIAAFTVFHVREHTGNCGGTVVTVLHGGHAWVINEAMMAEFEKRFRSYLRFDAMAIDFMLGRHLRDESKAVRHLMSALTLVRATAVQRSRTSMPLPRPNIEWDDQQKADSIPEWFEQVTGETVWY